MNDFSKKLCKTRDKYYKLCREELPKADADYGKVENEKKLYEAQVRITNKYFSQFYTRDLPSELRAMEEGLVRRVFSIQETLKKLVLVKKISNEKIAALNDDVLAYLDEVDSLSELDELLKKYNPENTPFIYSDI